MQDITLRHHINMPATPRPPAGARPSKRPSPRKLAAEDSAASLKIVDRRTADNTTPPHIVEMRSTIADHRDRAAAVPTGTLGRASSHDLQLQRIHKLAMPVRSTEARGIVGAPSSNQQVAGGEHADYGEYADDFEPASTPSPKPRPKHEGVTSKAAPNAQRGLSFTQRQDNAERSRRLKLERKQQEEAYAASSPKLECPLCGSAQSFDEKKRRIHFCQSCEGSPEQRRYRLPHGWGSVAAGFFGRLQDDARRHTEDMQILRALADTDIRVNANPGSTAVVSAADQLKACVKQVLLDSEKASKGTNAEPSAGQNENSSNDTTIAAQEAERARLRRHLKRFHQKHRLPPPMATSGRSRAISKRVSTRGGFLTRLNEDALRRERAECTAKVSDKLGLPGELSTEIYTLGALFPAFGASDDNTTALGEQSTYSISRVLTGLRAINAAPGVAALTEPDLREVEALLNICTSSGAGTDSMRRDDLCFWAIKVNEHFTTGGTPSPRIVRRLEQILAPQFNSLQQKQKLGPES